MKKLSYLLFLFFIYMIKMMTVSYCDTLWDRIMEGQAQDQIRFGNHALYLNSYQKAVRYFEKAVQSNPRNGVAHRQLGVAYYWTGAIEQAVDQYLQALELNPNDPDTHLVLGIAYTWLGDFEKAREQYEETLRLDPKRSDAEMNLGSIYDGIENKEEAIRHLKKAISIDPKNPIYHLQIGSLYNKYNNNDLALNEFKYAVELAPDYEDVYLELGAAYERIGNIDKAKATFRKALKLKPGDKVASLRLGSILRHQKEDFARLEKIFRQSLSLTPEGNANSLSLAVSYRGEKKDTPSEDPLNHFKKNLEQIPDNQGAHITIEAVSEKQIKLVLAQSVLEQLKKPDVSPYKGFKLMMELVPTTSRKQRAQEIKTFIDNLQKKLKEIGTDKNLRMNMQVKLDPVSGTADSSGAKNKKPKAMYQPRFVGNDAGLWILGTEWMRLVTELIERDFNMTQPDRYFLIEKGIAYLQLGQADTAQNIFNSLIEKNNRDVLALQGLSVSYVELGDIQEAINCYKKILVIEPKNSSAIESIKWLKD